MKASVMQNNEIRIRETWFEDLEWVLATERHPDHRDYVYNWSRERHLVAMTSSDERHFIIERIADQCRVGYLILSGFDSEHEVISFDRITISHKGRGYGRQTVRLIKKLCFEAYGCHRLWLDVFDFNSQARRLYESEGFIYEGTLRGCKKKGKEHLSMDVLSMLEEEYRKSPVVLDDL